MATALSSETKTKASPAKNSTPAEPLIYLDGEYVPKSQAKISIFDHGLLYGDGVFEGIRAYNGRVFRLDAHLKRLYNSARAITLKIPLTVKDMEKAVVETVRMNQLRDAYIRLVVTRGIGDLGLAPWKCPKPTVFIIADKITLYPDELYRNGLKIITVPTRRNVPEALNPNIKSLNYLNNILAKIEAKNGGAEEALMLDQNGFVAECTGDNIFIVQNGELSTPPAYVGTLDGITKQTVQYLAGKLGISNRETVITRFDLYNSDECFLTGTAAEVIPVVEVDTRVIGTGKPGSMTLRLIDEFHKYTQHEGTPVYKE